MDFKVPVAFVDVALLHVEVGIFFCTSKTPQRGGGKMATLVGQKNGKIHGFFVGNSEIDGWAL